VAVFYLLFIMPQSILFIYRMFDFHAVNVFM
jgi:hypothetical protein